MDSHIYYDYGYRHNLRVFQKSSFIKNDPWSTVLTHVEWVDQQLWTVKILVNIVISQPTQNDERVQHIIMIILYSVDWPSYYDYTEWGLSEIACFTS